MTNSTETFWSVDGQSLQTYAFNIVTLGGDRMAPPQMRGEDIVVPYKPGSIWVPKVVAHRVITLGMWVIGANEDGSIPDDENARRTFDRNWRMLRNLLWQRGKQFTLTKRFWVETAELVAGGADLDGLPTDGDWTLITASAKASYAGGLTPLMSGPSRAAFTVDLMLNDPYFYGAPITVDFSTAPSPGPVQQIHVLGDDQTSKIHIDFQGPVTTPTITLSTLSNDADSPWLRYSSEVEEGDEAHIDVAAYAATHTDSLHTYTSTGYVKHFGTRQWLVLEPGPITAALSVQSGTGTASLTYQPAYL